MFDETDILLIIALALGKSQEDAAVFAGISDEACRVLLDTRSAAYAVILSTITEELRLRVSAAEDLTREQYVGKRGKLRGKASVVKELALNAAIQHPSDIDALTLGNKVADAIEDRDFGKPKEIKEVRERRDIVVWNPQPLSRLTREERDILDAEDLLLLLPADAIEAEVVETS